MLWNEKHEIKSEKIRKTGTFEFSTHGKKTLIKIVESAQKTNKIDQKYLKMLWTEKKLKKIKKIRKNMGSIKNNLENSRKRK